MSENPSMSAEEARASLEQLRDVTHGDNSYQPAPARWIVEFHEILEAIATREAQVVLRLDELSGVTMGYLHNRVLDVLRDFDHLVAEQE